MLILLLGVLHRLPRFCLLLVPQSLVAELGLSLSHFLKFSHLAEMLASLLKLTLKAMYQVSLLLYENLTMVEHLRNLLRETFLILFDFRSDCRFG